MAVQHFAALAYTLALQAVFTGLGNAIGSSILHLVLGMNQAGLEADGCS